jgi:hypothetical protein
MPPAKLSSGKAAKPAKSVTTLRGTPAPDNVALMRDMVTYYKTHRDEGRQLLVQAGIYTPAGRLTKAYGG